MKCPFIAVAIINALLPSPRGAQAKSADPCATQANTIAIDPCLSNQLEARDNALNGAYKALLKRLEESYSSSGDDYPRARRLLVEAQRAWISFRDHDLRRWMMTY
jgi:uncharacterized protein YecT (DUF1311 family)